MRQLFMIICSILTLSASNLFSMTFDVTVTADGADGSCDAHCSLREAVIAANESPGADVINLPQGVFALTVTGADEDACRTGDLDITEQVSITGAGWGATVLDGLGADRVFDVRTGAGPVQIASLTIRGGSVNEGSAVRSMLETHLHLAAVSCVGNHSSVQGGAVRARGPLVLADCVFAANTAGSLGGAVMAEGSLEIVRTTFNGNRSVYGGGAVLTNVDTTVTIDDSVFMANIGGYGGGVDIDRSEITFTNVTFTGNASAIGAGGAISANRGSMTIRNCTLSDNAGSGNVATELYGTNNPEFVIENSIVSGPGRYPLCAAPILSNGHNFTIDQSCGLNHATDIAGSKPGLRRLRDNTGSTWTLALLAGSPAIDAGGGQFAATDQRGVARPVGPAPDIGAYEAGGDEPPIGLPSAVPVIAHVDGVGGTPWRSDVAITNPGDDTAVFTVRYAPPAGAAIDQQVDLAAGATVLFEDIVASVFGSGDGRGMLTVTPPENGPVPVVASRTFAVSGAERLGQGMPALDPFPEGVYYITGLREDADYRSNIGIAASDTDANVQIDLFRGTDGAVGSTFVRTVAAGTQNQWRLPAMFPNLAQQGVPMTARVRIVGSGVPYGSLVDQASTDAVTLIALPASPARFIPVVAHNPGLQGTFWRSDLYLHNPNPVETKVYTEYLPENTDNHTGGLTTKTVTIPAYGTATVADVAGELFDIADGKGVLMVVAAPDVAVASRTYTTRTGGGTYGLGVPALPLWERTTRQLVLTGIRASGGFRTNIGIIGGENTNEMAVRLVAHDGSTLKTAYITVEARSLLQMSVRDMFPGVAWGSFPVGSVFLDVSSQLRAAYSSTVDGSSQDPIFAVATPVP